MGITDVPPLERNEEQFRGTQVRDDGAGPLLLAHRQRVLVVRGPDAGLAREVASTHLTIGTAPTNDLVLTDPLVSRKHAEISVVDKRYIVRDLGSTNGTLVSGTPVMEAFLAPGARIVVGNTEILFEPKQKWERLKETDRDHFGELYGCSAVMRTVFTLLEKVSPTDLSCMIFGETGTGKELAARAIHAASPRASKPFIVVDCGAVTKNLIEAELFGHEKGAFTGADRARVGAFELANGGTIFLDELGELPLELQPKLLRALESREIKRLGAPQSIEVNVRVVAATHRNLGSMIASGQFREDLYYRLAEVAIDLPPLRERAEDIPVLVAHMITEQKRAGGKVTSVHAAAMDELKGRPWRGNVRELRNVLRRAMALASGPTLQIDDLLAEGVAPRPSMVPLPHAAVADALRVPAQDLADELPIKEARDRWIQPIEREYLVRLVQRCEGDLDVAAVRAGVHRKSLERLLRQHGIKPADWRRRD